MVALRQTYFLSLPILISFWMANKKKISKISKQVPVKKTTSSKKRLDEFLSRNSLLLTFSGILLLIIIIFSKFISGNSYYLFKDIGSDSLNQVYPQFKLITRIFSREGFPLYSFGAGMGSNVMSFFSDAFVWIVIFFGYNNVAHTIIFMELAKIILAGLFFYQVLKYWKFSATVRIMGALLYSFSGFMIVGGGWTMFSSEACYFALLLLSFEMLYHENKWYLFPVPIALFASFQPFYLYLYGFFLVLYFLFRHFNSEDPSWKKLTVMAFKMTLLSILGLMISSFFLFNNLNILLNSPRVGGHGGYFDQLRSTPLFFIENKVHYITAVLRLLANDMIGNGSNFRGWYNYLEAPMFYIGLLPVLLMPQIFLVLNLRKRIIYAILLGLFLIAVVFPHFRYTFWLFTGDYYRGLSFLISLIFLLYSLQALQNIDSWGNKNIVLLAVTLIVLLVVLYYPYANMEGFIDERVQGAVRNFLVLYTSLIVLRKYLKNNPWPQYILLGFIVIEMGYFDYHTVNDRVVMEKSDLREKTGYNDYSLDAVNFINDRDKGFFRINKDSMCNPAIHGSINDAEVQGYYGTSMYNSFNPKYYIFFQEEMGIIEKGKEFQTRWAPGLSSRPLLLNLASNKYFLKVSAHSQYPTFGYDYLATLGNVQVLQNKHYLPLGFTYDHYLLKSDFQKITGLAKETALYKAVVIEDKDDETTGKYLEKMNLHDTSSVMTLDVYFKDIDNLKTDTLRITEFRQNRIKGKIDLKNPKMLFFSIPYDEGWHLLVDGKEVKSIVLNIGFFGSVIPTGLHSIELYFKPLHYDTGIYLSMAGIFIYLLMLAYHFFMERKKMTPPGNMMEAKE